MFVPQQEVCRSVVSGPKVCVQGKQIIVYECTAIYLCLLVSVVTTTAGKGGSTSVSFSP